jgi:cell cycle arrest protein BUB3
MSYCSRNNFLVVATANRKIQIYDVRKLSSASPSSQASSTGLVMERESSLKFQIRSLEVFQNGTGYASGSIEGRVSIDFFDDAVNEANKYAFKCHREKTSTGETVYPVHALAVNPVFGSIATGGGDGGTSIWDYNAKKRIVALPTHDVSISALSFRSDGLALAIAASYAFEQGEKQHRPDAILVQELNVESVKPKNLV